MINKTIFYGKGKCENCKKIRMLVQSGTPKAKVCVRCANIMFDTCMKSFFEKTFISEKIRKESNKLMNDLSNLIEGMRQEFLHDLSELLNNLEDDLELDLGKGEKGYATHKESYGAIKSFTHKIICNKIVKWEKKR